MIERRIFAKFDKNIYGVATITYSDKNVYFAHSLKNIGFHESAHPSESHIKVKDSVTGKTHTLMERPAAFSLKEIEDGKGWGNSSIHAIPKDVILCAGPTKKKIRAQDITFELEKINDNTVNFVLSKIAPTSKAENHFQTVFRDVQHYIFKDHAIWIGLAIWGFNYPRTTLKSTTSA